MSSIDVFNSEELQMLQYAPILVFGTVAASDGELDADELEMFGALIVSSELFVNRLAREIFGSIANNVDRIASRFFEDLNRDDFDAVDLFRSVADLLDDRVGPDEAWGYKQALVLIGQKVAEASGPIFEPATDDELSILDGIMIALRMKGL